MFNFRESFIFGNSVKDKFATFIGHDLPTSINDRVILPFCDGLIFIKNYGTCENITVTKIYSIYRYRNTVNFMSDKLVPCYRLIGRSRGGNQTTCQTHTFSGPLRIVLKFLLKLLRNRCARTFTPERLQLQPSVSWQVNKKNSPACSTSNLHRKQKGCV